MLGQGMQLHQLHQGQPENEAAMLGADKTNGYRVPQGGENINSIISRDVP